MTMNPLSTQHTPQLRLPDRTSLRLVSAPDALADGTLDDPVETHIYAQLVRRAVYTLAPRSVLDVGCGTGTPTLSALRAGAHEVVGIDPVARNVSLARETMRKAAAEGRVHIREATWEDVVRGTIDGGGMELVVANPPYVPGGEDSAVDGGPRGTRLIQDIIARAPERTRGLGVLFGSISDPRAVLTALHTHDFCLREVLAQSVPFGRYTSRRSTLSRLLELRKQRTAWFCDVETMFGHAPYAYLTMGVVAHRGHDEGCRCDELARSVMCTLADYQMYGPAVLPFRDFGCLF